MRRSEQVGASYTDEHPMYIFALKRKYPGKHETINHGRTNGIGDGGIRTFGTRVSALSRMINPVT
jgi:hypothetical protein